MDIVDSIIRQNRFTKMKDGRTHLAHKAEHAVDMETGAIVSVTVRRAPNCTEQAARFRIERLSERRPDSNRLAVLRARSIRSTIRCPNCATASFSSPANSTGSPLPYVPASATQACSES